MAAVQPSTLLDCLRHQAQQRPHAIALRRKQLGAWHSLSWREVTMAVEKLAAGLARHGFKAGDALLLFSHPREEALLLSLAAQWNGGVAIPLDPHIASDVWHAALAHLVPRFVFTDDESQLDRLLAYDGLRVIDANPRNLAPHPHPAVIDYRALSTGYDGGLRAVVRPHDEAFAFVRVDTDGKLLAQRLTHATLVREARHLVRMEQLTAGDEAFAARSFAAATQARYLIAPWVLSGFRLNFPESLASRDNDRRELAPTLVAGTRETYARVAQLVDDRLPGVRSWRRRLISRAQRQQGGTLARTLTWWFITRPLREVIGFSRTRAALVIGPPLDEATGALFAALRVDVHGWPDTVEWQRVEHLRDTANGAHDRTIDVAQQPAY